MSVLHSVDPRTGETFGPAFQETSSLEVRRSTQAASDAFRTEMAHRTFSDAALLESIANRLDAHAPALREQAMRETGLAETRLDAELARTTGQLRAFSTLATSGTALDPILDTAALDATPGRPDQRRMNVPIGPIAVFAAGNFPFAFGVACGDTVAAFAAGCPVVLKAHPGHPGTSAAIAEIIAEALRAVGAPAAWFTLLQGVSHELGQLLATAEGIEGVAFTGSRRAGLTLACVGALRARPIPVFAEMASLNPLLITPRAAAARGEAIAQGLASSITSSAGQLCTKPGLIALLDNADGRQLITALEARLRTTPPTPMLTSELQRRCGDALHRAFEDPRVKARLTPTAETRPGTWQAPALAETSAANLRPGDPLLEEMFGPATLVVWCADEPELTNLPCLLPGSLTATLHAEDDEPLSGRLLPLLASRAGRLIFNGYPTGVTVGDATVHTGPYPASTSPAHTSVGMTSIRRFQRPVAYQDFPETLLPPPLKDGNPLNLNRNANGTMT